MLRELRLMRQRPVYLLATIGVMAFCTVFFLTFLRDGMPEDLPVGVMDMDNSSLSRNITRQIDATQLGRTLKFESYRSAREALQTGEINAFCVFPDGMYEDVISGRQPTVTLYVNSLYFVGGALAYKDLLTMMNMASGGVQRELLRAKGMNDDAIMGQIQPIVIDAHQIGNVTTDYGVYLTNVLLPGILEMIVILVTVFALGSELKYGTSRHMLEKAGGSMSAAMIGKLIPYTVLFHDTVLLGGIPYGGIGMEHVHRNIRDGALLPGGRFLHHRDAAYPEARTQHLGPVQRTGVLPCRVHFPGGSPAALYTRTCSGIPSQALLPDVCPGSDFRQRVRGMVSSDRVYAAVPFPASSGIRKAEKGLQAPEFPEELTKWEVTGFRLLNGTILLIRRTDVKYEIYKPMDLRLV